MSPRSLSRWFAITLYSVAILGALIVPHAHQHVGCCHGAARDSHAAGDDCGAHAHEHTDDPH
ncbi:MAG: hypothetical protein R3B90_05090 [Planctomycetaceae bacterium]